MPLSKGIKEKKLRKRSAFRKATRNQVAIALQLKSQCKTTLAFYNAMIARNLWITDFQNEPKKWRLEAILEQAEKTPLLRNKAQNQILLDHLRVHLGDADIVISKPDKKENQLTLFS